MKDLILESLSNTGALELSTILLNNGVTIIIALFIMFTYRITYTLSLIHI